MRVALLVVAVMAMIALASATTITETLTGTWYTAGDCSTGPATLTLSTVITGSTTSATSTVGCQVISGTGSAQIIAIGTCTSSSWPSGGGTTIPNSWQVNVWSGTGGCPAAGSFTPAAGGVVSSAADSSITTSGFTSYPDKAVVASGTTAGCFLATTCTYSGSASTLVVPSILLVALAFAARKLAL